MGVRIFSEIEIPNLLKAPESDWWLGFLRWLIFETAREPPTAVSYWFDSHLSYLYMRMTFALGELPWCMNFSLSDLQFVFEQSTACVS